MSAQTEASTIPSATNTNEAFSISQLITKNSAGSSYSWLGVLDFLHSQYKQMQLKESEWALEKYLLQSRTKELEGIVQGLEKIVTDIGRRCKMLEVALRQERLKHQKVLASLSNGGNINDISCPNFVGQLLQENMDAQLSNIQTVPKRKAKQYRPLLQKILSEVGIKSIFSPPASPKDNTLSNRPSALMQTPNQQSHNSGQQSPLNRNNNQPQQSSFGFPTSNTGQPGIPNVVNPQNQNGFPLESQQSGSFSFTSVNIAKPKTQHQKQPSAIHYQPALSNQSARSDVHNYNVQLYQDSNENQIQLRCHLRSHIDAVRDACFFPNIPVMVSASEDCQVKLWDVSQMKDDQNPIEPYLSLREHTGPIFAVAALELPRVRQNMQSPFLVFSAGSEGTIKCWQAPLPDDFDTYGPTEAYQQCYNSWTAHSDALWQLKVNQTDQLLLSAGADGFVKLWSVHDQILVHHEPKPTMVYSQRNQFGQTQDTPSSICWSQNLTSFICGYVQSLYMQIFEIESGRILHNLKFTSDQQFSQPNCIVTSPVQNVIYSAHEDGKIRIFETNGKLQSTIQAHGDAVTSISISSNGQLLYSVSHDGKIKIWDLKKNQVVFEQMAHCQKYDESIHQLSQHSAQNLLASCGADGVIKIYQTKFQ